MSRQTKGMLYKRGNIWYLEYYSDGKRFKQSLGTGDKKRAEELQRELLHPLKLADKAERLKNIQFALSDTEAKKNLIIENYREKLLLSDAWQRYLESGERPQSGEGTLKQYFFQWKAFVDWAISKDKLFFNEINREDAGIYLCYLKNTKKLSSGTVNKHINLLKLIYEVLSESEKVEVNPFGKIKRLKAKQHSRKELSLDKIAEVCDAADGELKILLFLGLYTGMRLKDCCLLNWSEIDLFRGVLIHVPFKTANHDVKVHIPIHPCLKNILEDTPKSQRKGYVLKDIAKLYLNEGNDKVTDKIQLLFKTCGIEIYKLGTGPGTGKRAILQYGYHSLRHSAVTLLQESGVAPAVIQALVGHSTVRMSEKYTHIGLETLRSAISKFPALSKEHSIIPASIEPSRKEKLIMLLESATDEQLDKCLQVLESLN